MKRTYKFAKRLQRGFSLIELMVAIAILGIVVAIAVQAGNQLVRTNNNVTNNVDLVQQGRQFMDQISSDIHMAGFPNYKLFDQTKVSDPNTFAGTYNTANVTDSNASGLISASATKVVFEGDVDNSGTVSRVVIQLCAGTNPGTSCTPPTDPSQCPCTMQRGTLAKSAAVVPNATIPFYTELTGVMNTNVFTFYDYSGNVSDVTTITGLVNARAIRIQLQVRSTRKDIANGSYAVATLDTEAKLSN